MRLLKLTGEDELALTPDLDQPPPYAILSHTWGTDEVLFDDFANGCEKSKQGYAKIEFCAQQARRDGLDYIWVDTCCIDKASSVELSEAIISMFSWYRNAEKCYVLLSDVALYNGNEAKTGPDLDLEFRHCRWFTRGWTLQELIAPETVEFFSREGKCLGTKDTLTQEIHEITKIPISVLRGAAWSDFSIEERLQWAEGRQTKMVEDSAYCLFGLFDVFLPPIYGEGAYAYMRLRRTIHERTQRIVIRTGDADSGEKKSSIPRSLPQGTLLTLSPRKWDFKKPPFAETNMRYHDISAALPHSCAWMLETSQWRNWMEPKNKRQHHGVLCIKGKPGAGKSTMMKYLSTTITPTSDSSTIVTRFFFNFRGTDTERGLAGMCLALLFQLLQQVPGLEDRMPDIPEHEIFTAAEPLLRSTIEYVIVRVKQRPMICLIDAIDECIEGEVSAVMALIEYLTRLAANHKYWLRICWSSRHYPHIASKYGTTLTLEDHQGHFQDIENYLVKTLKLSDSAVSERMKLKDEIYIRSGGMFLWVRLVILALNHVSDRGGDFTEMMRTLDEVPYGLAEFYGEMLYQNQDTLNERSLCLQWMLFANRPLNIGEMCCIILPTLDRQHKMLQQHHSVRRRFISITFCGLVKITKDEKVFFIHDSVREWLLESDWVQRLWPAHAHNFTGSSHQELARCCQTYIKGCITGFDDGETQLMGTFIGNLSRTKILQLRSALGAKYPFMEYAVENLLCHANSAAACGISQMKFINEFPNREWIWLRNLFMEYEGRYYPATLSMLEVFEHARVENLIDELEKMQQKDLNLAHYYSKETSKNTSQLPGFSDQSASSLKGPETDSGYMSLMHDNFTHLPKYRIQLFPDVTATSDANGDVSFGNQEDSDDAMTVYSDTSSLDISTKENYQSELADALASKVFPVNSDDQALERILEVLPDLLKEFALKIGYGNSDQERLKIMHFVHKHRHAITGNFEKSCTRIEDEIVEEKTGKTGKAPLVDIMNHWYKACEVSGDFGDDQTFPEVFSDHQDDSEEEQGEQADPSTLSTYRDIIFNLPSYDWLLKTLHRESFMSPAKPNQMEAVRQQIMSALSPSRLVSRKKPSQSFKVVFHAEWDLLAFLKQQCYQEKPSEAIGHAITLTGTSGNAQALTCAQYLRQTWPFSGQHLIDLVQRTLEDEPGCSNTCALPDSTHLTSYIRNTIFVVEVEGTASAVADIGEQVAWLGAALRFSSHEVGCSSCTPFIEESPTVMLDRAFKVPSRSIRQLRIRYTESGPDQYKSSNGQCWHGLFRNPTIVKGFPIPRRYEEDTGLEIPLHMMAGLAQTQHVDTFKGKIFIKGFSTMLVPTRLAKDVLSWHLVHNKDGERVSYLDGNQVHEENLVVENLESARHILGWCSIVRYNAGTADANYAIDESGLKGTHSKCRLKDVHVSRGRLIKGGEPYAAGNRDKPYHMTRDSYADKLSWISKKSVMLWDVYDQRGWLINGSSALLHLLRTSLKANESDELKSQFVYKSDSLRESRSPHTADPAVDVLLDPENQNLAVHLSEESENTTWNYEVSSLEGLESGRSYSRLRHRVERIYNVLEKLIDHQVDIAGPDGCRFKDFSRRDLEGWDFTDLATNEDPIYPRNMKLRTFGKAWVDFIRSIQTVVLFGNRYGEILRPSVTDDMCPQWDKLPCNKFYLGVSMSDLSRIIKRHGSRTETPIRLTDNLIWYQHDGSLAPCDCADGQQIVHSNPVQSVFPAKAGVRLGSTDFVELQEHGAVIFGHNTDLGYFWGDRGEPERGTPPPSPEDSENEFNDSTLGSSIDQRTVSEGDLSGRHGLTVPTATILTQKHYKIGIVCALPKELLAVRALFDREHAKLKIANQDDTFYTFGSMSGHNIVAACLPCDVYGTNSAASVASHMLRSFRAIKCCFLVGIGGGVPSYQNDIRLGDIVVSTSVIQHDLGKTRQNADFKRTGTVQRPPKFLMNVVSEIRSNPLLSYNSLSDYTKAIETVRPDYRFPGREHDRLFETDYTHDSNRETCEHCDGPQLSRSTRQSSDPQVFYGPIASGNQVIKDAVLRDRINKDGLVLCFEMEAAGVMTTDKFLIIRGICDYADSHKSDVWQEYAAASAAAYTKFFLSHLQLDMAERTPLQTDTVGSSSRRRATSIPSDQNTTRSKKQRHLNETES